MEPGTPSNTAQTRAVLHHSSDRGSGPDHGHLAQGAKQAGYPVSAVGGPLTERGGPRLVRLRSAGAYGTSSIQLSPTQATSSNRSTPPSPGRPPTAPSFTAVTRPG